MGFLGQMDGYHLSYRTHKNKPDPEAFTGLFEAYGIIPEQAVFIDDNMPNIEAAKKLGLHTIRFASYEQAKKEFHPEDVSPFVYAHHVVCALESENGTIYTGFCIEACSGVMNLCAERVAALNMYVNSGQTKIKRLIAFRDKAPFGGGSGMPCGACREFLYQLNEENENMEIMVNYETRETITLKELIPDWWGKERFLKG